MKSFRSQTYQPDQIVDITRNFAGVGNQYEAMAIPLEFCPQQWKVDVIQYHADLTAVQAGADPILLTGQISLYRQVLPMSQASSGDVVLRLIASSRSAGTVIGTGTTTANVTTITSGSDNLDLIGGDYYVVWSCFFQGADAGDIGRYVMKGVLDNDANIAYPKYDVAFTGGATDALTHPATITKGELTRNITDWPWVCTLWG